MKRSGSVIIGGILAGLTLTCLTGCGDPESSDYSEICVDDDRIIVPEVECDNDHDHHSFIYIPGGTHVGAHGSRYTGTYSTVKPTSGTIGRVPSTGGFGTHAGTGS